MLDAAVALVDDLILDNVSNRPLRRPCQALTPTGTLMANGGGSSGSIFGPIGSALRLLAITALIEAGKLTPIVDRTYFLTDVAEVMRYVEREHARAKAVGTVP